MACRPLPLEPVPDSLEPVPDSPEPAPTGVTPTGVAPAGQPRAAGRDQRAAWGRVAVAALAHPPGADFCANQLPDGTTVVVVPVGSEPADRDLLRTELQLQFAKLSAVSRYQRFFSAAAQLSPGLLHALVDTVDNANHVVLMVLALGRREDGDRISPVDEQVHAEPIALARFVRDAQDSQSADVAITVFDDWQFRGVGKLLMVALAHSARRRGVTRFTADVLAENTAIRALLHHVGVVTACRADDYYLSLTISLCLASAAGGASNELGK